MTITRDDVVACARTWLGTRWQHQQRLKGVACDCAGLVIGVVRELYGIEVDVPNYGHDPHNDLMRKLCNRYLVPIDNRLSFLPGDVLLMTWDSEPHHMGIASTVDGLPGLIHAYAQVRKVTEHHFDVKWLGRIVAAYSFPGVA
jgi:NlpC/P60 family putative phage cell wall peptidase